MNSPSLLHRSGSRELHWQRWALWALVILYGLLLVKTAWLADDAYIGFRVVDNFVNGYGLRWNVIDRVQVITDPLWILLQSAVYALTREMYLTNIFFNIAVALTGVLVFVRFTARSTVAAMIGMALFILSKAYVDFSTSGLDNALSHLLLLSFFALFIRYEWTGRYAVPLSMLGALAMTNRLEAGLLVLPPLAFVFFSKRTWRHQCSLLLAFAPFFIWEVFAIVYFGFPFPNTYYAKLPLLIPARQYWVHGLWYLCNSFIRDPVLLLTVLLSGVFVILAGRRKLLIVWGGILLYIFFATKAGGDFMSGRFLTSPYALAVCLLTETYSPQKARQSLLALLLVVGLINPNMPVYAQTDYTLAWPIRADPYWVTDERGFFYRNTGFIKKFIWNLPMELRSEWAEMGKMAAWSGSGVILHHAVGYYGFFAGPGVDVIDPSSLPDAFLSRLPPDYFSDERIPTCIPRKDGKEVWWRAGHLLHFPPEGYMKTLETGVNYLKDPRLRVFYDDIARITRGPLFTRERWEAILRVNMGYYRALALCGNSR